MSENHSYSPEIFGILAGLLACLFFLIFHQLTISNIWFSSFVMLPVSALAGYTLVKSYFQLFESYSHITWIGYNFFYIIGLGLLALLSVLIFTPEYTSGEILNSGGAPPEGLVSGALPLTISWLFLSTIALVYFKDQALTNLPVVLATSAVIYLTLGLNVAILGKVDVQPQHQYLVEKLMVMNIMLGVAFLLFYILLHLILLQKPSS